MTGIAIRVNGVPVLVDESLLSLMDLSPSEVAQYSVVIGQGARILKNAIDDLAVGVRGA